MIVNVQQLGMCVLGQHLPYKVNVDHPFKDALMTMNVLLVKRVSNLPHLVQKECVECHLLKLVCKTVIVQQG